MVLLIARGQRRRRHLNRGRALHHRHAGEVGGILAGQLVAAVRRADFDGVGFLVQREGHGLVGQVLEGIEQDAGGRGNAAGVAGLHGQLGNHAGFQVGSRDGELTGLNLKEKVLQNGHHGVVRHHAVDALQLLEQRGGGYNEFHGARLRMELREGKDRRLGRGLEGDFGQPRAFVEPT